jgi:hypothetical protein
MLDNLFHVAKYSVHEGYSQGYSCEFYYHRASEEERESVSYAYRTQRDNLHERRTIFPMRSWSANDHRVRPHRVLPLFRIPSCARVECFKRVCEERFVVQQIGIDIDRDVSEQRALRRSSKSTSSSASKFRLHVSANLARSPCGHLAGSDLA